MAASKEETLKQTLQVVNNFSKFVEESGLPCAALLLRAIDFGAALLESESEFVLNIWIVSGGHFANFIALSLTLQVFSCVWNKKKSRFKTDFRSDQHLS